MDVAPLVDRAGGPIRAWLLAVLAFVVLVVAAALAFPRAVYVEIIWQYYWAPVVADAQGWQCVDWAGGEQVECGADPEGPTATPGYTWQSYAGYVPVLLLLAVGIVLLIQRLKVTRYRAGFYGLFPFMLFGGALRVVEDANVASGHAMLDLPWAALLISPFIYFVVFAVALAALVLSVGLERQGLVEAYEYPLFTVGTLAFVATLGLLSWFAVTTEWSTFYPLVPLVVLVIATVVTAATWYALEAWAPTVNEGTAAMGIVVIWAHAVDGVANVVGLDWATSLGLPANLVPKHPINAAIVDFTGALLPQSVVEVTGEAWPFLLVKLAAAVLILYLFNDELFEESPHWTYLLLIIVVAVGLGPGTRDMLRATFGV